jgi:two-component system chemotaxis sensor kinase CheA
VFPTWFENKKTPLSAGDFAAEEYTILFAEDSQFFRTIVRSYLEAKNYTVLEAHDGQEAFEMLESAAKVDLVLTDLEMPRLNGFELAEAIRASEKWSHLPIMALTSLASDEDRERGLKAGVNEYCVKLDRTEVLDVVDKLLKESSAAAV